MAFTLHPADGLYDWPADLYGLGLTRSILAPTRVAGLGSGMVQVRRQHERPVYLFALQFELLTDAERDILESFVAYHQGDTPFWLDGTPWNSLNGGLIGTGTGTQTQWFLPNRWVESLQVWVNGGLTGVTLTVPSGLITFAAPPAAQAIITASYHCWYKCLFWNTSGESLLSMERWATGAQRYQGLMLREVLI